MKLCCELCNKVLNPESEEAMICSYECTFCEECASKKLDFVCPNCSGNLQRRPKRIEKDDKSI